MPQANSMPPAAVSIIAKISRRRACTRSCRYSMNACVFAGVARKLTRGISTMASTTTVK